jgi:predicted RNA-binding Zn-ribbon protein involved in translation (DUF1610 family)
MNPMASQSSFPCPDCGTDWPCPEYILGRKVTRWCETCRRMFDVVVPPLKSEPQS